MQQVNGCTDCGITMSWNINSKKEWPIDTLSDRMNLKIIMPREKKSRQREGILFDSIYVKV